MGYAEGNFMQDNECSLSDLRLRADDLSGAHRALCRFDMNRHKRGRVHARGESVYMRHQFSPREFPGQNSQGVKSCHGSRPVRRAEFINERTHAWKEESCNAGHRVQSIGLP